MSEATASMKAEESQKESASKSKASSNKESADRSYNLEEIRDLADLFEERGFTEFEFENENIRVRLSKMTAAPVMHAAQPVIAAPATTPSAAVESSVPTEAANDLFKITSPIVGTFYRSPGPDKDPYVSEGSKVTSETVVCIVEAMKLMNEIQAETSGEVVEIYVENGQPVEFGQPLFGIRK
ncbi:MAG: acetyl-CoA carboxylase biotin carboxyl carrier protein [Pyrinomonadaceae bacterium]